MPGLSASPQASVLPHYSHPTPGNPLCTHSTASETTSQRASQLNGREGEWQRLVWNLLASLQSLCFPIRPCDSGVTTILSIQPVRKQTDPSGERQSLSRESSSDPEASVD